MSSMPLIHYHFDTIGSTNSWAKEHALEFNPQALTIVTASGQTAGRGRFKRHWVSPIGLNIYATFCFFIEFSREDMGHVPQLLALSTAQVLEELSFQPALKWPNDVLLSNKKVAGILCETVMTTQARCVVCGLGLNVNMPLEELQKIDRPATSLLAETQQSFDLNQIFNILKTQFSNHLSIFLEKGFNSFFRDFKKRSIFSPGQKVCFHDNQQVIEGTFEQLNEDGSIEIRLKNGELKTFYAGEFL